METDLFAGSYELIDAARRLARGNPGSGATVDEIAARVAWSSEDVKLGLEELRRAGVLQWAQTADEGPRALQVTSYGLGFLDQERVRLSPRDD